MGALIPDSTPVPMPWDWAQLYGLLSNAWAEKADSGVPEPPVPLILAGAAFSSAMAIRQRWVELIHWSNNNGFAEIFLEALPPPPLEDVATRIAGVSVDGSGWCPEFGEQNHEPKIRPSKEAVAAALKTLQAQWAEVVGHKISSHTRPHRFTGSKLRRLVVIADENYSPPWGSWYFIEKNPRTFTAFRKSINAAISPLEVDTVTFTSAQQSNQ